VDDVVDNIASNVATMVEDGSCISFFSGELYESLGKYLKYRNNLSIHTYTFIDVLMVLIKCVAVNNRKKYFP
jgi:hypothetical protein